MTSAWTTCPLHRRYNSAQAAVVLLMSSILLLVGTQCPGASLPGGTGVVSLVLQPSRQLFGDDGRKGGDMPGSAFRQGM